MRGASGAYTGVGVAADALAVERQQALLDLADRCSSAFYTSTLEDVRLRAARGGRDSASALVVWTRMSGRAHAAAATCRNLGGKSGPCGACAETLRATF
jgi:hypothetical protein